VLVLGIFEVSLRLRFTGEGPTRILDPELGWRTKANLDLTLHRDIFGDVHFSTGRNGFRRWDDLDAPARILTIGDSYTQAREVSDGNAYYDLLSCGGGALFVYGAGGYGSLQEYMILDRHLDEIRPTVVIWQFSPNDLINNLWELESRSLINNNRMERPYWESGEIRMRYPSRSPWMRHTMLGRWLAARVGIIRADRLSQVSVEYRLDEYPGLLQKAVAVTDDVMAAVRARTGDVPIVAFEAAHFDPFGDSFEQIAHRKGLVFVAGIPAALEKARSEGIRVDGAPKDGHWNATGHLIAGGILRDTPVRRGWLPASGCGDYEPADPVRSDSD